MKSNRINAFGSFHPVCLMLYFLCQIVVSMFTANPLILTISTLGGVLFFASISSVKVFLSDLLFYIPMFLLITIINPLFSHNGVTPLFFMNGNPVTLEAILYGADIALMLISVIYWCKCYSIIFTTDKFLFLFGKIIPKLALVFSMALRFIPLFKSKLKEMRSVQKSSGAYDKKGFVNKLISEVKVFSALITWALENSSETANSMKARGYGLSSRTHFSMYRFFVRDVVLLFAIVILFSVTITGIATDCVSFEFYPRVSELSFDYYSIMIYAIYSVFSFLPFLTEIREELVWKYSVSKI